MSLVERDPVDYSTISQDEQMLNELERRDGIFSFIFHELERPRDNNLSADKGNKEPINYMTPNQVIIVDESDSNGVLANPYDTKPKEFLNTFSSAEYSHSHTDPVLYSQFLATLNHHTNTSAEIMKSSSGEISRMLNPPFTNNSMSTLSSSCRFLSHSKLYDFISSNSIRVRIPTPRFSNVSVPMVRNRRHPLKESSAYRRSCGLNSRYTPDLRALFPHDPDVHAPFVKVLRDCDAKIEEESEIV